MAQQNDYYLTLLKAVTLGEGHKGKPGDYYVSAVLCKNSDAEFNRDAWIDPTRG